MVPGGRAYQAYVEGYYGGYVRQDLFPAFVLTAAAAHPGTTAHIDTWSSWDGGAPTWDDGPGTFDGGGHGGGWGDGGHGGWGDGSYGGGDGGGWGDGGGGGGGDG